VGPDHVDASAQDVSSNVGENTTNNRQAGEGGKEHSHEVDSQGVDEVVDEGTAETSPASSEAADGNEVSDGLADARGQGSLVDNHDLLVDQASLVHGSVGTLLFIDSESACLDDSGLAVLDHGQASDDSSDSVSDLLSC
jgi:hypothetical protein